MNNKTKKLLLQYIKLNTQPIKATPCKDGVCSYTYVVKADDIKKFIESLGV